jgi:hypothetical protein
MKTIHSQQLASFLMTRKFPLIRTEPDRNRPGANVFIFKWTQALEDAITEYSRK